MTSMTNPWEDNYRPSVTSAEEAKMLGVKETVASMLFADASRVAARPPRLASRLADRIVPVYDVRRSGDRHDRRDQHDRPWTRHATSLPHRGDFTTHAGSHPPGGTGIKAYVIDRRGIPDMVWMDDALKPAMVPITNAAEFYRSLMSDEDGGTDIVSEKLLSAMPVAVDAETLGALRGLPRFVASPYEELWKCGVDTAGLPETLARELFDLELASAEHPVARRPARITITARVAPEADDDESTATATQTKSVATTVLRPREVDVGGLGENMDVSKYEDASVDVVADVVLPRRDNAVDGPDGLDVDDADDVDDDVSYVDTHATGMVTRILMYTGLRVDDAVPAVRVDKPLDVPESVIPVLRAMSSSDLRDPATKRGILKRIIAPLYAGSSDVRTFASTPEVAYRRCESTFLSEVAPAITQGIASSVHAGVISAMWSSRDSPAFSADKALRADMLAGKEFTYATVLPMVAAVTEAVIRQEKTWMRPRAVANALRKMAAGAPEWVLDVRHDHDETSSFGAETVPLRTAGDETDPSKSGRKKHVVVVVDAPATHGHARKSDARVSHDKAVAQTKSVSPEWPALLEAVADVGENAIREMGRVLGSKDATDATDATVSSIAAAVLRLDKEGDAKKLARLRDVASRFYVPPREVILEKREEKREARKERILEQINREEGAGKMALIMLRRDPDLWAAAGLEEYDTVDGAVRKNNAEPQEGEHEYMDLPPEEGS